MEEQPSESSVSSGSLVFLVVAACLAAVSAVTHSKIHTVSYLAHHGSVLFGGIAIVSILPRWFYAMFFELFALIAVFFIGLFQIRRWVEPLVGGKGTPILLIHGFCNDAGVWFYIRKKLVQIYSGPIYAISLKSAFRPLEEHAQKIQRRVTEILKESGSSDIILIGHSMGGLVASLYAMEYAAPSTVKAIITIASPFHGTYMASIIPAHNARQMRYQSPFCKNLSKKLEESSIPIYQMSTLTDEIIIPSNSCLLKLNPERQYTVKDIGHAAMLFSPRVATQVCNWIRAL